MFHRIFSYLVTALVVLTAMTGVQRASAQNVDSVLRVLDTCLVHRDYYEAVYAKESARLRRIAVGARTPVAAMQAWQALGRHEILRHNAVAMDATCRAITLARRTGDARMEARLLERKAMILGLSGLPWEGRALLDSAYAAPNLRPLLRQTIWTSYYDLFDYFYSYKLPATIADRNFRFLSSIEDSVRRYVTDPAVLATVLQYATHNTADMVRVLTQRFESAGAIDKGMFANTIANKYAFAHDVLHRDYWLTVAAICNIRAARHDNDALGRLAERMMEQGDYRRAARYAAVAYEEAKTYGSRGHVLDVAPVLAGALTHTMSMADRTWQWAIALAVLSAALVVLAVVMVRRARRRKAAFAAHRLAGEEKMAAGAKALEEAEAKAAANEEYVTHFLEMGLDTILKFEQMKQLVLNKLQSGDTARLKQLMKDPGLLDNFRQNSLSRFDIAFLRRYPGFVREVNALLRPEATITLPDNEIMNNELRLLAFMRLGITDGSKIAAILGVSINTIYFYRSKLRGMARDRSTFERDVCGTDVH